MKPETTKRYCILCHACEALPYGLVCKWCMRWLDGELALKAAKESGGKTLAEIERKYGVR